MVEVLEESKKIKWLEDVRKAWQIPAWFTVWQWADRNRILDPLTSAEPGRWRTDRTPYLREIMDAFRIKDVHEITIMSSTQIGKTESLLNMLGYAIDQDPAPALFVLPGEKEAKDMSHDRIQPMIKMARSLSNHLTSRPDDITRVKITMDRMILYFAWSNSPASLASKPIRYLFMDEIDKYPRFSGREADPVKLAMERTRTFWNRKIVKCSTPTTREGYIFREYERSDRREYYVPCPHCGEYQTLIWKQIKWPEEERRPEAIKEKQLALYECIKCKGSITDKEKIRAMKHGVWVPRNCTIDATGKIKGDQKLGHRGYWLNALYSPWLTFSEIVFEFLASQDNIESLMNFVNSWLAEVWEEKAEEITANKILKLSINYPSGVVPEPVQVLTAGVDVQKDHFYYVIRGWGFGEESWLIRAARVESWEQIISDLFMTVYSKSGGDPEASRMAVRMTCIDAQYRTDEVHNICRRWNDVARAIRGEDSLGGIPYTVRAIDRTVEGSPLKQSVKLWRIDTYYFKDKITRMIQSGPEDPAQFHIYNNVGEDYIKQMSSEHKVIVRDRKTGRAQEIWKKKSSGIPNHYWDAEVYAASAAKMIHVDALRKEGTASMYRPIRARHKMWVKNERGRWAR